MTEPDIQWPKRCNCGEEWSAEEWEELPSDGRYFAGSEGWMELRTCVCGARLTVASSAPDAVTPESGDP
ncbi:MAG TPA: hypothetical protein VH054_07285 [Polyangiaceae bacterium]|jgi:hypothetical protein|nr:hypothetical protein [Polyangiaceae bacterium]